MSTNSKIRPVVLVFGPTAVGKTRFLLDQLGDRGEVVVADSIQIYRGLDIGSAKPSAEERALLPHHLLDILEPSEAFDVGLFVPLAEQAVDLIHQKNKIPVLCGGTAFYFWNFLFGLPTAPPSTTQTREQAARDLESWGPEGLRSRLKEVDAPSAQRIGKADHYRLLRAWEVWLACGRPLSSFPRKEKIREDYAISLFSLERPPEELLLRLDQRIDAMLAQGLVEEIRALVSQGYDENTPALRGIGYAEFLPWILRGESSYSQAVERLRFHSRQYAKRQRTFFRRIPGVVSLNPDQPEIFLQVWRELTQV
ncbi:MAG: tRNA (adenosine(37)-N6)-dimethylallyltransferase MiaA [Spirochaetales bacterium]|nr:tRNA (adenosine(37)-N6)-dimethylallyltransferase MiaA [Spirochaetales bacterium]